MKKTALLIALISAPLFLIAQDYQFFNLGLSEGLCDKFAYTLNQDDQGFLWIGTSQGLCRYDGKEFEQDFKGDSLSRSIAHSSLLDSRHRLWFGHEDGLISVLEDGRFRRLEPPVQLRSKITAIREAPTGHILVLSQQYGILVYSPELELVFPTGDVESSNSFSGKLLYDLQFLPGSMLFLGTNSGLSLYSYDSDPWEFTPVGDLNTLQYLGVKVLESAPWGEEYWAGTEDDGVYRIRGEGTDPSAYQVDKLKTGTSLEYANVASIAFDGRRRVWINAYGEGVHRFDLNETGQIQSTFFFDQEGGMPDAYINDLFIDEEGNQWFSSNGNGISVLRDQAFTFFSVWPEEAFTDVTAVYASGRDYWYGGQGRLAYSPGQALGTFQYYGLAQGVPDDRITALFQDQRGDLYIGTSRSGLYKKRRDSERIVPVIRSRNSLENIINAIDGNGDSIFVATLNGVYSLNPVTGSRQTWNTNTDPRLPHNKINDLLVDRDGIAWVATEASGIISVSGDTLFMIKGNPKLEFKTLAEADDGTIWAGTDVYGIFRYDPSEERLTWYSTEAGLKSNYIYALAVDPKGYLWAGHRMGLSRINVKKESVSVFGKEAGFSADIRENAIARTPNGQLLFGTTQGVIQYDAFQAREDSLAPRLSLKSVVISNVAYDPSEAIKLKYGRYQVRIDFIGINLSAPDQVKYLFKLDGYEDEWRELSGGADPSVYYSRVEDGDYTFMLKACDGDGNCTEEALSLDITVKIPIWKAWWFIVSLVVLVLASVFAYFKIREHRQKLIQEYLQRQLDERTREVVQQKEEIEIKNRDITDSLNYAQRIQASILPSIQKLHNAFTGSFVFYQPRDIVSGDFYWYEKVDDNRFIVVCADSTGHGVPGAFMSMIGTTLIKDICLRSGISKPSEVLTTLDVEVREALNQNVETSGSNDGMDIIVAEVDMKTHKFTVSSAMRPVIIYKGDEQIYVKGSRSSIGGQLDEDRVEKVFIDQEFQLNKGDIVYMFSDGYPDQFGGPLGRKFKMVRLKNLLRDIHDKPMDEQYNYIKSNFFLWKEDLEQVDDVLFMGIKI